MISLPMTLCLGYLRSVFLEITKMGRRCSIATLDRSKFGEITKMVGVFFFYLPTFHQPPIINFPTQDITVLEAASLTSQMAWVVTCCYVTCYNPPIRPDPKNRPRWLGGLGHVFPGAANAPFFPGTTAAVGSYDATGVPPRHVDVATWLRSGAPGLVFLGFGSRGKCGAPQLCIWTYLNHSFQPLF